MFNTKVTSMSDAILAQLLDSYAQEAGYKDIADLKDQYHPRAYAQVIASYVARARYQIEQQQLPL